MAQHSVLVLSPAQSAFDVQTWSFSVDVQVKPIVVEHLPQVEVSDLMVQAGKAAPSALFSRTATAQHSVPASLSVQLDGPVHPITSVGSHDVSHVGFAVVVLAQHCWPLGHGTAGHSSFRPESTGGVVLESSSPVLPPSSVVPPLPEPEPLPLEAPPLDEPLPLPPDEPLLLPDPPLELPFPPSFGGVVDDDELLQAIQTTAQAATAAAPKENEKDARDAMGDLQRGGNLARPCDQSSLVNPRRVCTHAWQADRPERGPLANGRMQRARGNAGVHCAMTLGVNQNPH
jgi:hypothetical protein